MIHSIIIDKLFMQWLEHFLLITQGREREREKDREGEKVKISERKWINTFWNGLKIFQQFFNFIFIAFIASSHLSFSLLYRYFHIFKNLFISNNILNELLLSIPFDTSFPVWLDPTAHQYFFLPNKKKKIVKRKLNNLFLLSNQSILSLLN